MCQLGDASLVRRGLQVRLVLRVRLLIVYNAKTRSYTHLVRQVRLGLRVRRECLMAVGLSVRFHVQGSLGLLVLQVRRVRLVLLDLLGL